MQTIKTYFNRAPFYNALIVQVDYFRVARQPKAIAITSYKPTSQDLAAFAV
jgi:hypothetical protein